MNSIKRGYLLRVVALLLMPGESAVLIIRGRSLIKEIRYLHVVFKNIIAGLMYACTPLLLVPL